MKSGFRGLALAALLVVALSIPAQRTDALSAGIPSSDLGPSGCNQCHTGGGVPLIKLHGPNEVESGSTNEYQLSIVVRGSQDHGGLNASVTDGVLSTGGEFSGVTRVVTGAGGLKEVTHSAAKEADIWDQVEFSFLWTAPASFTEPATLNVWGNAVDRSGSPSGDQASFTSLQIYPAGTLPPEQPCAGDLSPLNPDQLSDPALQKCRVMIGKAGLKYVQGVLKIKQKCMQDFQRWGLIGEAYEVCVGTDREPPSDLKTAQKVLRAEVIARAFIGKKCTDADVAALNLCADTVEDLETCLVSDHRDQVESLLRREFGDLRQTDEVDLRKCQKVLSKEAGKFVATKMKAIQKCLAKRDKGGMGDDAVALCTGSVVDGTYVPPNDAKTALLIAKAENKMRSKVSAACTDGEIAALDSCAGSVDGVEDCLVCTHRRSAYGAMDMQYGGN